jgi:BlaI family transcriptional regulator, penicillinase repressor
MQTIGVDLHEDSPMPARTSTHPTEAELEVLSVLWRRGPSTVREVHETLQADRETSLTTTLKILQVMTDKGLTTRSDSRPQVFSAAKPEAKTQAGLLKELVRKAFDGSVRKLMVRAVEDGGLSGDELREIQKLIDTLRKENRGAK